METNIYVKNGYRSRGDYLASLACEYGLSLEQVEEVASLLGPAEDFDGLVTELLDHYGQDTRW